MTLLRLSRYIRNGAVLFSMLGNFSTGYAATAINKQTVALQTTTLPALVNISIGVGGYTYDVYYSTGACTAAIVNENPGKNQTANPNMVRLTYQSPGPTFQLGFNAYGSYCVWMDAWMADGITKLPATVYTTVTVSAPTSAKTDGTIKITPAPSTIGATVGSAAITAGGTN